MGEKRSWRVLIATLGQAPGTVTGMLDALAEADGGPKVYMDEVVTLYTRDTKSFPMQWYSSWEEALVDYTSHPSQVRVLCQQLGPPQPGVAEEKVYGHYERVWGKAPKFDPRVGYLQDRDGQGVEDITNNWHNFLFLELAYQTISERRKAGHEVYVSLAGGRKTMSALLYLAVQFSEGVTDGYHLIVSDEIEWMSGIEQWGERPLGEKLRILHPGEESTLVPIPIITLPSELRKSQAFKEFVREYFGGDVAFDENVLERLVQTLKGLFDKWAR